MVDPLTCFEGGAAAVWIVIGRDGAVGDSGEE